MLERNSEKPAQAGCGGEPNQGLDANLPVAPAAPISEIVEREPGEGEVDHSRCDLHPPAVDLATIIDTLREEWRDRQAWRRAEKSLLLQAKARCRALVADGSKVEAGKIYSAAIGKGDHQLAALAFARIEPLERARSVIEADCKLVERRLIALAKQLPVAGFVEQTRGVGLLSLAGIVGEAGDLANYATHQRLWKRMGLAVMPDGRQRRVGGADALAHGYSPVRRSLMWNVGTCIVKAGGPLKAVYDARKAIDLATCEAIAADPVQRARYARHGARYAPRAHAHNRRNATSRRRSWRRCGGRGRDR